jgi:HNH endonuclease
MRIELRNIKIADVFDGYVDRGEDGVVGYGGILDIRPAYQREFVYKEKQREAVIETILKDFPLNVMYWAKKADETFELLDGQQRTLSICQYLDNKFSILYKGYPAQKDNLPEGIVDKILDYELMVYVCEGTEDEKLEWFKTINIAGERLTSQELRNSVYTGSWLADAKRKFSKTGCVAYNLGSDYLTGSPIRQDYLETVLDRISEGNIEEYMAHHQNDENADALWQYFQCVIRWVQRIFPTYRKEMKGIDWGIWYNRYKDNEYDSQKLEKEVERLMQDEEIKAKKGIYLYLLSGDEKYLSLRTFSDKVKREVYEEQRGICPRCKQEFAIEEMEADHIDPWSEGGKTDKENCQMLCRQCNRRKSDR